jgi:hypothetical protein
MPFLDFAGAAIVPARPPIDTSIGTAPLDNDASPIQTWPAGMNGCQKDSATSATFLNVERVPYRPGLCT